MINFVLYILGTIGLTHIIVDGRIAAPLRDLIEEPKETIDWYRNLTCSQFKQSLWTMLKDLIVCHQCSGTWCGFLMGYLLLDTWTQVLAAGFAGSYLSMLTAIHFNYMEARSVMIDEH